MKGRFHQINLKSKLNVYTQIIQTIKLCVYYSKKCEKGYFGGHGQGHYLYKKMDQERVYVVEANL